MHSQPATAATLLLMGTTAATTLLLLMMAQEARGYVHFTFNWFDIEEIESGRAVGEKKPEEEVNPPGEPFYTHTEESQYTIMRGPELMEIVQKKWEEFLWKKMNYSAKVHVLPMCSGYLEKKRDNTDGRKSSWVVNIFGVTLGRDKYAFKFKVTKKLLSVPSNKPFYIGPTTPAEWDADREIRWAEEDIEELQKTKDEVTLEIAAIKNRFDAKESNRKSKIAHLEHKENIEREQKRIDNALAEMAEHKQVIATQSEVLVRARAAAFGAVKRHLCCGGSGGGGDAGAKDGKVKPPVVPAMVECHLHHGADELRSMADLRKLPIESSVSVTAAPMVAKQQQHSSVGEELGDHAVIDCQPHQHDAAAAPTDDEEKKEKQVAPKAASSAAAAAAAAVEVGEEKQGNEKEEGKTPTSTTSTDEAGQ